MRFLLDEDLSPKVAEVARGLGLDVISVHEVGRRGRSDEDQLRFACQQNRIFVTRNRDDFRELVVAWFRAGGDSPGVLIVPYSLPNKHAERIAYALKQWAERWQEYGSPRFEGIDYLSMIR
jgi:predicted nuclease of predicted toxin-antitoxin system